MLLLLLLLLLLKGASGLASGSELHLELLRIEPSHLVGLCDIVSYTWACTALWNQSLQSEFSLESAIPWLSFPETGPHLSLPTAEGMGLLEVLWSHLARCGSGNHSMLAPEHLKLWIARQSSIEGDKQLGSPEWVEWLPLFLPQSSPSLQERKNEHPERW